MNTCLEGIQVSNILILAIMATMGYVFGTLRQRRKATTNDMLLRMQQDLGRAQAAVNELEKVVGAVHDSTATHYARLKGFKGRVAKLNSQERDAIWQELCREVESILNPTLQLVSEIANAQERIRYQSNYLMSFSEMRSDPLTGLGNRRALDYVLSTQFSLLERYGTPFSLAILDIDHFKDLNDKRGHLHGDQMLRDLTALLADTLRAVDIVARYGGDEFVIVMPQTDITGAGLLGDRLRAKVEQDMPFTASVGVTAAGDGDTPESLFQRADALLYRAKTGGRNRMLCDRGETAQAAPAAAVLMDAALPLSDPVEVARL